MTSMNLAALSRKELQVLAKEFQLCRGNAKSDVILQHVQQFVAANSSDGETRVLNALGLASYIGIAAAPATPKKVSKPEPVAAEKKIAFAVVASPVVTKAEKTITPRKEETPATPKPESAKKIPEAKAAHKSPAKSKVATEDAKKQKKTPEKTSVTSSPVVSAKKATKVEVTPPPATKQTPPKNAPAKKSPVKKSPAKETPVKKSPAKENPKPVSEKSTPKNKRPALASLDANVVKSKKAKKSEKVTVDSLVSSIVDLAFAGDGSKVRCTTTGHEMKADVDVITTYIQGKSYQRAQLKKQSFAAYAPMFTAHPDEKKAHLLWCHVTETEHPREVARIKAHMAGSRYQKELPRWKEEEAARVAAQKEAAAKAIAKAKARAEKLKQLEKAEKAANEETASDFSSKKRKRRSSSKKNKQMSEEVEQPVEEKKQPVEEQKDEAKEAKRPAKRSRKHKSAQK